MAAKKRAKTKTTKPKRQMIPLFEVEFPSGDSPYHRMAKRQIIQIVEDAMMQIEAVIAGIKDVEGVRKLKSRSN